MFIPLDGPAAHGQINVSTTPVEVKAGGSPLDERQVVTIQPVDGEIYFGYTNSVTSSTGTKIFRGQVYPLEAKTSLTIWVVAASGTVDVRVTEVS